MSTKTSGWQKTKDGYIYYEADSSVLKGRQYRELPKIMLRKSGISPKTASS